VRDRDGRALFVEDSEDSGDCRGTVGRVLRPDAFADRLCGVSLDDLTARGIRGIIVDLDNTLVGYGQDHLADDDAAWVRSARERGFGVVLVSNNFTGRVTRIGEMLGVPAISSALKPLPRGFLQALHVLGTPRTATVVVGDQLFTDVLGAKLCGLHSILTEPIVAHDWLGTRVLRLLERVVLGRKPAERRDR
jgi:HAD superfamily phosphatase (TIGR01668 family)